jgi:hypothetical protein
MPSVLDGHAGLPCQRNDAALNALAKPTRLHMAQENGRQDSARARRHRHAQVTPQRRLAERHAGAGLARRVAGVAEEIVRAHDLPRKAPSQDGAVVRQEKRRERLPRRGRGRVELATLRGSACGVVEEGPEARPGQLGRRVRYDRHELFQIRRGKHGRVRAVQYR